MTTEAFIQCRVPAATKVALRAAAERQQLTESALLKRLIDMMLQAAGGNQNATASLSEPAVRGARLQIRLTTGDRQLLAERAARRYVPAATYASVLIRAHLRALTPLPDTEVNMIRQATRELAVIGRNLNQIARAANTGGHVGLGVGQGQLQAILKICEALRDHFRAYVSTNIRSWESGDAAT